jgi:hypothetical protein
MPGGVSFSSVIFISLSRFSLILDDKSHIQFVRTSYWENTGFAALGSLIQQSLDVSVLQNSQPWLSRDGYEHWNVDGVGHPVPGQAGAFTNGSS